MRSSIPVSIAAALLVSAAAYADCSHTAPRQVSAPAAGLTRVDIVGRAGSLSVVGKKGLTEIRATGTACASDRDMLEKIKLTSKREGSVLRVEAEIPDEVVVFGWTGDDRRLDFTVEVPEGMAAIVDDGSGDLDIEGVGQLKVDDGSGDARIRRISGGVEIDDGSGDLEIADVAGAVKLDDGSGDVTIRGAGSVLVDDDGSGDIDIRNVKGDVRIDDDGSGGIDVADVGGTFTVGDDGSGGISFHNVAGKVSIPRD